MDPVSIGLMMLSGALSAGGAGLNFLGNQQANKTNMMMNTGAWKAQQVQAEASSLGVSPLAVLGNTGGVTPMQSVGDPGLGSLGQNVMRAATALSPADDRLKALQLQSAELDVQQRQQDVIASQLRNSKNAVAFQPSNAISSIPLPVPDPRYEPEIKPALQRFRSTGGTIVGPSPASQQSFWSPVPGAAGSAILAKDVLDQSWEQGFIPLPPDLRPDISRWLTDVGGVMGR